MMDWQDLGVHSIEDMGSDISCMMMERTAIEVLLQRPEKKGLVTECQVTKKQLHDKRRAGASNGQRYPLPCCSHLGNLKCIQQGKGYC